MDYNTGCCSGRLFHRHASESALRSSSSAESQNPCPAYQPSARKERRCRQGPTPCIPFVVIPACYLNCGLASYFFQADPNLCRNGRVQRTRRGFLREDLDDRSRRPNYGRCDRRCYESKVPNYSCTSSSDYERSEPGGKCRNVDRRNSCDEKLYNYRDTEFGQTVFVRSPCKASYPQPDLVLCRAEETTYQASYRDPQIVAMENMMKNNECSNEEGNDAKQIRRTYSCPAMEDQAHDSAMMDSNDGQDRFRRKVAKCRRRSKKYSSCSKVYKQQRRHSLPPRRSSCFGPRKLSKRMSSHSFRSLGRPSQNFNRGSLDRHSKNFNRGSVDRHSRTSNRESQDRHSQNFSRGSQDRHSHNFNGGSQDYSASSRLFAEAYGAPEAIGGSPGDDFRQDSANIASRMRPGSSEKLLSTQFNKSCRTFSARGCKEKCQCPASRNRPSKSSKKVSFWN
ncbi:Hypothetical protein NTJ_05201 [Nesidiocoris tenuis]|uniref:Uncharacterized protein n=1 Tax=Nesidiocoris tenuis TaxID=355587 RepID=A0ABN7AJF7_9HEMI|nr:Hypothetical protein NTJ_05201 [Nesidiocoris tenuis]